MALQIIYRPGGSVTITPIGYPGEKCHEAARPYETARSGECKITEGEVEVAVPVTVANAQKVGGGR